MIYLLIKELLRLKTVKLLKHNYLKIDLMTIKASLIHKNEQISKSTDFSSVRNFVVAYKVV